MKKMIKIYGAKLTSLLLLVFLVAFIPSGSTGGGKMSTKQMQDSINFYKYNTMINYDLIKKRIQ